MTQTAELTIEFTETELAEIAEAATMCGLTVEDLMAATMARLTKSIQQHPELVC